MRAPWRWTEATLVLMLSLVAAGHAEAQALEVAGPSLAAERTKALAQQIEGTDGWGALADTFRLARSSFYLDPSEARAVYQTLSKRLAAGQTQAQKIAAAHLLREVATYDHHLGEPAKAAARVEEIGLVTEWLMAGPFENGNMAGFDVGYGPEDRFDPEAVFEGKATKVGWRSFDTSVMGTNSFAQLINPQGSAIVYAVSVLEAPSATKAVLRVGAHGAFKVWLNGRRVARVDTDFGGGLDQDAFGVRLERGANVIMVKLAGQSGPQLDFSLRLTASDGRPLQLKAHRKVKKGALLASSEGHRGAFDVGSPSEAAVKAALQLEGPARARALVDAALISKVLRAGDPATPWRDLAEEAIELASGDVSILKRAVEVLPEHWRRLNLMKRVAAQGPDDGWFLVQMGYEVSGSIGDGHLPEALKLARRAALVAEAGREGAKTAPALSPRILEARLLSSRGFHAQALALLEPLRAAHPRSYPLLDMMLKLYGAMGRSKSALSTRMDILKVRRLSPALVFYDADQLLRAAKPQEALERLDALLAARPDQISGHVLRSRALFILGRSEQALATLDGALVRSPGALDILLEKAQMLERISDVEQALSAYEEALVFHPEKQSINERIRALRPDESSYEASWRWGDEMLVPAPDAAQKHAGQDFYYIGDQQVIKVAPSGKSSRFKQMIVHVLTNEGAKAWSNHRVYYSPGYERAEVVSVRVRKSDGTILENHRRADYDAGRGAGNLYYLRRFAYIEVPPLEPGDVVEYATREIEVGAQNFREGYFGDLFFFQGSFDKDHVRYVVVLPEEMTLHIRKPKLDSLSSATEWLDLLGAPHLAHIMEVKDVARVKVDQRQPSQSEIFEYTLVSTYETWDQVGKWWWNLIKDQLVVDAEIRKVVKEVTRGLTDDRSKMEAIHNWVVKNTRYVGIEFGVHGWKPYRTTLCMRRKFGDCKDKASLIKVMLNEAGIDAHLVLIRTRRLGSVASQPANLSIFNHAIAYVPEFDLFLDGTAEFSGTKELPNSDQGQLSVIVADGGKVTVRETPIDAPGANRYVRILDVDLRGDVTRVKGELRATGADGSYFRSRFESKDKRRENLEQTLSRSFPGATLVGATFLEVDALEKPVHVTFTFEGGGFVKQIGDTLALYPAGRELRLLDGYAPEATRDQDLMMSVPSVTVHRVTYRISDKFKAVVSKSSAGSSRFGSYKLNVSQQGDSVEFEVTYSSKLNRVSVKDYEDYRKWLKEMDRALNQRLVLEPALEEK